jgi:hypothetical protein
MLDSCSKFNGRPIKCHANKEDKCVYSQNSQCRLYTGDDHDGAKKTARENPILQPEFEEAAGNMLLKAYRRKRDANLIYYKFGKTLEETMHNLETSVNRYLSNNS